MASKVESNAIVYDYKLFQAALAEMQEEGFKLMKELWYHWCHIGYSHETMVKYIKTIVIHEKDMYKSILAETIEYSAKRQEKIEALKSEAEKISAYLSVDIQLKEYEENTLMCNYILELEDQLKGYREQVHQRKIEIKRLLEWQGHLKQQLGVPLPEQQQEDDLDRLRAEIEALQGERDKRAEIFLKSQIEVKRIMDKLQIEGETEFEKLVLSSLSVDFQFTDLNMERLAMLKAALEQKEKDHQKHTEMKRLLEWQSDLEQQLGVTFPEQQVTLPSDDDLNQLRTQLEVLQGEMDKRVEIFNSTHLEVKDLMGKLQIEPKDEFEKMVISKSDFKVTDWNMDHLEKLKIKLESEYEQTNNRVLVADLRTKIKLIWQKLLYSTAQQHEEFLPYFQDTANTLSLHRKYLDKITQHYENTKTIYELVETRKELWTKMVDIEARANDPGRYNNRGGQLLREEKERKVIASKLSKIEDKLRGLVMEHEDKTGEKFNVHGKPLLQLIADEWENRKTERHNKISIQKNSKTSLLRPRVTGGGGRTNTNTNSSTNCSLLDKRARGKTAAAGPSADSGISPKRHNISGRLAARLVADGKPENVKRKFNYDGNNALNKKIHKVHTILKHKGKSGGRRSSATRYKMESTSSTLFEEHIDDDSGHSSMAVSKSNVPTILVAENENSNNMVGLLDHTYNIGKTPTRRTQSASELNNIQVLSNSLTNMGRSLSAGSLL